MYDVMDARQARKVLGPVAPARTRLLGRFRDPQTRSQSWMFVLAQVLACVFMTGFLVVVYDRALFSASVLAMAGVFAVGLVVLPWGLAKADWDLWWGVYAASREAAGVSQVLTQPVPAWFELSRVRARVVSGGAAEQGRWVSAVRCEFASHAPVVAGEGLRVAAADAVEQVLVRAAGPGVLWEQRWESSTVLVVEPRHLV